MTRYDLLYAAALPALAPYLAWRRISRGKYTESAAGMLGRNLPDTGAQETFARGSLWLHAVSYGEVNAARAVAPQLHALECLRTLPLVVSTVTETGQAHARKSFPQATVTYFPADFSRNVRRFQAAFNPRVFVLLETELWPNFLMLAHRRGTRCFMLNAKLSDRSFPRYRRFRGMLAPALAALDGLCTQTELDAERFAALGIPAERIRVTGNCKFDLTPQPLTEAERLEWLLKLGLNPQRRWIVAGSTHPGEEEAILAAFRGVLATHPTAGLILCPRHPERFEEVARLAAQTGLTTARASAPQAGDDPAILVLDQMGVLARAYGLGEVAIVAGSFCPVGGHNLLEAAAHNIPVLFGPDMHSQREIDRLFKQVQAGIQLAAGELPAMLGRLLDDGEFAQMQAQGAYEVVRRNGGSAGRAVAHMAQWLK
jgi:3-deoxy-D-manno-octulosonic-acid transferase